MTVSAPEVIVKYQTGRHGRTDAAAKPFIVRVVLPSGGIKTTNFATMAAAEKAAAKAREKFGIGETR